MQKDMILVSTWGYDQTNVDFYQITKGGEVGKFIELRPIASNYCGRTGSDSWLVEPILNNFTGDAFKKKVIASRYDGEEYIKLSSYAHARLWSGKRITATDGH